MCLFYTTTHHYAFYGAKCNDPKSGSAHKQLQSYVAGPTVEKEIPEKNFRAFVVAIVGSCQILVREVDRYGNWVSEFQLAK